MTERAVKHQQKKQQLQFPPIRRSRPRPSHTTHPTLYVQSFHAVKISAFSFCD